MLIIGRISVKKIDRSIGVIQNAKKSPQMCKFFPTDSGLVSERNSNMELVPLKSSRTIYYPQNFKKLKQKKKIKLVKKTARED